MIKPTDMQKEFYNPYSHFYNCRKFNVRRSSGSVKQWIGYAIFVLFKTVITFPFVGGAIYPFIVGWNTFTHNYQWVGALICIPISLICLYDWIRSVAIPFWVTDEWKSNYPVWWEGGGFE